jgi:hypothetical protein
MPGSFGRLGYGTADLPIPALLVLCWESSSITSEINSQGTLLTNKNMEVKHIRRKTSSWSLKRSLCNDETGVSTHPGRHCPELLCKKGHEGAVQLPSAPKNEVQREQVNKDLGHRTLTMMDGGLDAPARLGSRCQSSSVTKGMKGCSRRRPVSRQIHSVSRVRFFAASSDPCMIGLMISMNTPHSLYCQKSYTTVVAAKKGRCFLSYF